MSSADVQVYEQDLNRHRLTFTVAHRELAQQVGLDAAMEVLDHAETWGLDETRRWLAAEAGRLGIKDTTALEHAWQLIVRCYDAMADMDATLSRREALLRRADSARELRLIHHGREFKVDLASKRVTYLDDGTTAPFSMERLDPPGGRRKSRDRSRDRDRR